MEYLCCGLKKKKKGPPGHRTNFQKSVDQNQSFFIPGLNALLEFASFGDAFLFHKIEGQGHTQVTQLRFSNVS